MTISRVAVIENGVVINIIRADPDHQIGDFFLVSSEVANIGDRYSDGVFAAPIGSLSEVAASKLDTLAARRWQAETSGITLAGMLIKTDEDTQRKITGAYVQADKNPAFSVRWKLDAGVFVTLDAATIVMIGDAVTAHIQTCFDREADLTADILAAEDAAALDAIDIEAGW